MMTSEVQVNSKDKIRLNILHEVLSGAVSLGLQFANGSLEDYASSIHEDGKRMFVRGKFNISEAPNNGDTLTIRPIMIESPLKIMVESNIAMAGKKLCVISNSTKDVLQEYKLSKGETTVELIPQNNQCYLLRVNGISGIPVKPTINQTISGTERDRSNHYQNNAVPIQKPTPHVEEVMVETPTQFTVDDRFQEAEFGAHTQGKAEEMDARFDLFDLDSSIPSTTGQGNSTRPVSEQEESLKDSSNHNTGHRIEIQRDHHVGTDLREIERDISRVEREHDLLSQKKRNAINHLEKIEEEYKKDYDSFEKEVQEFRARMEADASIISYYKDQDILPIEVIFQEIRLKLDEAEKQIRYFIEAKQKKTMEIEMEIKGNNRV